MNMFRYMLKKLATMWKSASPFRAPTSKKTHTASDVSGGGSKHVVVLSQFFWPEPSKFPTDTALALKAQGYRVSAVTGYPSRPAGKLYPEYKQRCKFSEIFNGVVIHRVPLVINHSRRALERVANFLSFSVTALSVTSAVKNADAVYVYATPATAAIPAQIWKKLFGIPYVLHVQDLWPESVTESGMLGRGKLNRFAAEIMRPWLQRLYTNADALIAISPGMRDLLIDRGSKGEVCSAVFNWADEKAIVPKPAETFSERGLKLLYAGNLGPMQDLQTVIAAAERHESTDGFSLTIAGDGILRETLEAKAAAFSKIEFLGLVPRAEIGKVYLEADFQLVTLKDLAIFRTTVPSKLQASLAAGVPVITTVKGDVAELIVRYEAGIVAEPEDSTSLASAIQHALDMTASERAVMGKNARRLYDEQMSRSAGTTAIVQIMDGVSGKGCMHENLEKAPSLNTLGSSNVAHVQRGRGGL